MREVIKGVPNVLETGCQWRALPKTLPPKSTVHDYLILWDWDGTLERACPSRALPHGPGSGRPRGLAQRQGDRQLERESAEKGARALTRQAMTREKTGQMQEAPSPRRHAGPDPCRRRRVPKASSQVNATREETPQTGRNKSGNPRQPILTNNNRLHGLCLCTPSCPTGSVAKAAYVATGHLRGAQRPAVFAAARSGNRQALCHFLEAERGGQGHLRHPRAECLCPPRRA